MARDGRGILRIAFACDTPSSKLSQVHRRKPISQPLQMHVRRTFLRECDAVHTRPNSSGHFGTIQTGPPGAGNDRSRLRLSHCRGPMVSICWTTRPSPPVWLLPVANRRSPSKSRNPKSALYFMVFKSFPRSELPAARRETTLLGSCGTDR